MKISAVSFVEARLSPSCFITPKKEPFRLCFGQKKTFRNKSER